LAKWKTGTSYLNNLALKKFTNEHFGVEE